MERIDLTQSAKSYAIQGFLCSEAVLLATSTWLGINNEWIPKIATGFGAGVGGQGRICGAVSGGIMALGLKFGRNKADKQGRKPYWFALEFLKRFEEVHGYVACRELTGCDFNTELGRKKYQDEQLWEQKCQKFIETAAGLVYDLVSTL